MVPIALALILAAPMQLAAAAGVEVSGGYDSTVINQLDLRNAFGNGGIMRLAIDIQAGHRTDTLRQVLRTRGEMFFESGTGLPLSQPNLTSLNRYTLTWQPDDSWQVMADAGYNVGQSSLLLQRTGDTALAFLRGVYGQYTGNLSATRAFGDNARLATRLGVNGRHAIDIPEGVPRGDTTALLAGTTASFEVGERNTFGATANLEALHLDGLDGWLGRVTGFGTWNHAWTETFGTTASLGVDIVQDQTDVTRSRWLPGPYAGLGATKVFPDQNLAFTLQGRYEVAMVNGVRCGEEFVPDSMNRMTRVALLPDGSCRPEYVIAGGAGRIAGLTFQALWRPFERNLVFTGLVTADHGVTQNYVQTTPGVPPMSGQTHSVGNSNVTALLGARWVVSNGLSVFLRYTFLFQHVDEPVWYPDIRRHVVMLGVTLMTSAGDVNQLDALIPVEEADTAAAIRSAAASSGGSAASEGGAVNAAGDGVLDDPLSATDGPPTPASVPGTVPGRCQTTNNGYGRGAPPRGAGNAVTGAVNPATGDVDPAAPGPDGECPPPPAGAAAPPGETPREPTGR